MHRKDCQTGLLFATFKRTLIRSVSQPMIVIKTRRLQLRTWTIYDAPDALAFWADFEVMKFIGSGRTLGDLDTVRHAILRAIAAQQSQGFCLWPVVEMSSGHLIGCSGFHAVEASSDLELAIHFARACWGNGYATEAATACVEYAFKTLGASRIVASTHPENVASIRVLEKVGFESAKTKRYGGVDEQFYELARPDNP
jgi:RimJ/RimL family protein N-acetyltransferase